MDIFYRLHARQQMAERGVSPADVAAIITAGNVIDERHHAGRPFPTQILLGWTDTAHYTSYLRSTLPVRTM